MNNYIVLDGKNYSTVFGKWNEIIDKPGTVRPCLDGVLDGTYGAMSLVGFEGVINVPVTARFTGWGIRADFKTTILKRETVVMTDHEGNSYNVHIQGPFRYNSLTPIFDGTHNVLQYQVRILIESPYVVTP